MARFVIKLAIVTLAVVVLSAGASDADDQPQSDRLKTIQRDVEEGEAALAEVQIREETVRREVASISKDLSAAERALQGTNAELQATRSQIAKLEAERAANERERQTREGHLRARFRSLYLLRQQQPGSLLLNLATSGGDFPRFSWYLRKLTTHDTELLAELAKVQRGRAAELQAIAVVVERQLQLKATQSARQAALALRRKERQAAETQLRHERSRLESALAKLKAQALRLETVVASLSGAVDADEDPKRRRASVPEIRRALQPYSGAGITSRRNSLPAPVVGKILQGFGKDRVEGFADIVFHKGVEYAATEGAEVAAVGDGRVIHVGRLPGYGTVVIVDHGKRSYSLYGRLDRVKVSRGEDLSQGGILGTVGAPDGRGRNFYFEIRQNGAPVNPRSYLRR